MKRLQYFTSAAVVALGLVLAPAAFARAGGGGFGGGHIGGFGGGHIGGFGGGHMGAFGGHQIIGGFHGNRFAGGFHDGGFHDGRFHGYRPRWGRGGVFLGFYPYAWDCGDYPGECNPAVGCCYPGPG
jgi:hypothetical protein